MAPFSVVAEEPIHALENTTRISFNQLIDRTKPACSDVHLKDGKLSKVGKSLKVAYCGFNIGFINNLTIQKGLPAPVIPEIPGQAGEYIVIDATSNEDSEMS